MEISNEILAAIASGLLALFGVFIGSRMSKQGELEKQKRERVLETCSEFLSLMIPSISKERGSDFYNSMWIAASKINLVCSKELSDLSLELATLMLDGKTDSKEFGDYFDKFVESAKKEIGN